MKRIALVAVGLLIAGIARAEVSITIYNQDLAVVRETRQLDFPKGIGELRFSDVASQIIPTSVHFSSDKADLLEQNYEYDLISSDKLMEKYTDRRVEIVSLDNHQFTGELLSAVTDIVLREADGGIRSIAKSQIGNVHFPDLPEGLITRPTLVWLVDGKGGKGDAEISYQTNGVSWEAEYVAVTDEDDQNLDLTGWVNVTNNSGATYKDATIKLMAGDVRIEKKRRGFRDDGMMVKAAAIPEGSDRGFQEQAFDEYHLYTLGRPSTLDNSQVKQLSLFPAAHTRVEKEYLLSGYSDKVQVTLIFKNKESAGLGMPLPKGKVRVFKKNRDGGFEFVGEDRIDHTPKDEEVRVSTGKAFDIAVDRNCTNRNDMGKSGSEETWVYKLRNHKAKKIEVVVSVDLHGDNWKFLDGTTPGWEKKDQNTVVWRMQLPPDEETILTYLVHYDRNW